MGGEVVRRLLCGRTRRRADAGRDDYLKRTIVSMVTTTGLVAVAFAAVLLMR